MVKYKIPIDMIGLMYGIIAQIQAQAIPPGYLTAQIQRAEITAAMELMAKVMAQSMGGNE
jgi:hypothetical protein